MTPARHMQTCVPLPVPRSPWPEQHMDFWHARTRRGRIAYFRHDHAVLFCSPAELIRHFGPRRPPNTCEACGIDLFSCKCVTCAWCWQEPCECGRDD